MSDSGTAKTPQIKSLDIAKDEKWKAQPAADQFFSSLLGSMTVVSMCLPHQRHSTLRVGVSISSIQFRCRMEAKQRRQNGRSGTAGKQCGLSIYAALSG